MHTENILLGQKTERDTGLQGKAEWDIPWLANFPSSG